MHEMAIAMALIDQVEKEAREQKARSIDFRGGRPAVGRRSRCPAGGV